MKILKKLKNKLKDVKGVDNTIEMTFILVVLFIILATIFGFSHLIYTNYKVTQFANESVRVAELYGEVGTKTYENIDKLKTSIGINPNVTFDKTGKINFLEPIQVTVELPYRLKIPFLDLGFNIRKSATGMSEVYWKDDTK